MWNLIQGILAFHTSRTSADGALSSHLAEGQQPDAIVFACCDSRLLPNEMVSARRGDALIVRSIGNIIAPALSSGFSASQSEAAAIEFALDPCSVSSIVVLGHSGCGAMRALLASSARALSPNLAEWLRHGRPALDALRQGRSLDPRRDEMDQLSQLNVLAQMQNVKSYPAVRSATEQRGLGVHGLWFDIRRNEVLIYEEERGQFSFLDEECAERVRQRERDRRQADQGDRGIESGRLSAPRRDRAAQDEGARREADKAAQKAKEALRLDDLEALSRAESEGLHPPWVEHTKHT